MSRASAILHIAEGFQRRVSTWDQARYRQAIERVARRYPYWYRFVSVKTLQEVLRTNMMVAKLPAWIGSDRERRMQRLSPVVSLTILPNLSRNQLVQGSQSARLKLDASKLIEDYMFEWRTEQPHERMGEVAAIGSVRNLDRYLVDMHVLRLELMRDDESAQEYDDRTGVHSDVQLRPRETDDDESNRLRNAIQEYESFVESISGPVSIRGKVDQIFIEPNDREDSTYFTVENDEFNVVIVQKSDAYPR